LQDEATAKRTLFRTFMMFGFHMIVYIFAVRTIRDTQCGFKLFSRSAAGKIFSRLHVERWAFDIELIYLAKLLGIPIREISVNWTEIDGSKINPLMASFEMARDIVLVWFRYLSGIWTL
jgi:dolichyl-phosphate beta-glucosyltransferase